MCARWETSAMVMAGYSARGLVERGGTAVVTTGGSDVAVDASAGRSEALPGPAGLLTAAFAA
ncbi:MAG: hypothetical protein M0Z51_06555, partial [Propionibacterium sp.]|nr:hypothetical protein [Propionibacterium sp.]